MVTAPEEPSWTFKRRLSKEIARRGWRQHWNPHDMDLEFAGVSTLHTPHNNLTAPTLEDTGLMNGDHIHCHEIIYMLQVFAEDRDTLVIYPCPSWLVSDLSRKCQEVDNQLRSDPIFSMDDMDLDSTQFVYETRLHETTGIFARPGPNAEPWQENQRGRHVRPRQN